MNYDDLTPEMLEQIKKCTTPEEIFAIANKPGQKLTDEEIRAISGGDINQGACAELAES